MDKNKRIMIGVIVAVILIGGVAIGLILNQTPEKADLSSIHTTSSEETAAVSEAIETESSASETAPETSPSGISASVESYVSGNLSIQYPVIRNMEDTAQQDRINELLKSNATSIITAMGLDDAEDHLNVACSIASIDRKRLTATYTGTLTKAGSDTVNLFYSNTLDLAQAVSLGLKDYSDAYTMAGYVLSDDVVFQGLSDDKLSSVLSYRASLDLDSLTKLLEGADFPLSSDSQWPQSFSYEKQDTICFSLPVPHELGDYVIVSFTPSTK